MSILSKVSIALTITGLCLSAPLSIQAAKPSNNPPIPNSVCIDAGHGGNEPGTSNGGILEKDLNLQVADKLETLLTSNGYTVTRTRTTDIALDGTTRANICNQARTEILVSIHHNGSSDPTVDYSLGVYQSRNSRTLASTLSRSTASALGIRDAGLYQLANSMLIHANMPATISEGYFLTNDVELSKLNDPNRDYRQEEAIAIYQGIVNYLSSN